MSVNFHQKNTRKHIKNKEVIYLCLKKKLPRWETILNKKQLNNSLQENIKNILQQFYFFIQILQYKFIHIFSYLIKNNAAGFEIEFLLVPISQLWLLINAVLLFLL